MNHKSVNVTQSRNKKQAAIARSRENLPERSNETPSLTDQIDKHTNTIRLLRMTIKRIRNQHSRNNLVSSRCNSNPNNGRNIPLSLSRMRRLHKEHHQSTNRESEASIAEPESVFRLCGSVEFLRASPHPAITESAAELFADDCADDDAEELEPDLLGIETEFGEEELGNFDCGHDGGEEEDHGVGDDGDHDGGIFEEREGLDEFVEGEGGGVDAVEL